MLGPALTGIEVADSDRARRTVEADDIGVGVHFDIESLVEHLR